MPVEESTGLWASFPTYWSVPGAPRLHGSAMYASLRPYLARLRQEFPFDALLAAFPPAGGSGGTGESPPLDERAGIHSERAKDGD